MQGFERGRLALVGCGNMGGAMLRGWRAKGLSPDRIVVQDPQLPPETQRAFAASGVSVVSDLAALDESDPPAVLIMAVKPQVMDAIFDGVAGAIGSDTVVLSVAAGRTLASFEARAPDATAIVRSIPNTPAAIGRGMTVCCGNAHVTPDQRSRVDAVLSAIGEVGWVDDEGLIDAATAVSGSGPAYVFHLAEALEAAAIDVGLAPDLARQLAVATVAGAGELLNQSDEPASQLRENVTSPNGTTAAALAHLMADGQGLKELMKRAVIAARDRSRELSG